MKKLDELIGECDMKAYHLEISFNNNKGVQLIISTKYLKGGNPSGKPKILYHTDWNKKSKKAIKRALKWINK
jgi:hypothetical protein